jgi:hypothetical protein
MLGYVNPKNFARAFKSYYGIAPSRWRSLEGILRQNEAVVRQQVARNGRFRSRLAASARQRRAIGLPLDSRSVGGHLARLK